MTRNLMTSHSIKACPHRHPSSLWYISASYALLMFTYTVINTLLVLFATRRLGMGLTQAYSLFGAFNAIFFTSPLIGGFIAEKFSYKRTGLVGLIFGALGAFVLSYPTEITYYLGLAIFTVGYGLATPASFCLVGLCYSKDDTRRDSGYTIFYMLFNIGTFSGTVTGGYLSKLVSYQTAFIAAGCLVVVGIIIYIASSHLVVPHPERKHAHPEFNLPKSWLLITLSLVAIVFCPIVLVLYRFPSVNNTILWILVVLACAGILMMAFKQRHRLAKYKLIAFLILVLLAGLFWSLYMLESSLMIIYAAHNVNRELFGHIIPPSVFYALDPLGVIIFGLLLSWLWRYLATRGKNPSLPTKFTLAMVAMGVGYVIFGIATWFAQVDYRVNLLWIVLGYVFLTLGEMLISPIGMSMVGRLAPIGKEGRLMGVWTLFIGVGAVLSGYLANFTSSKITNPAPQYTYLIYRKDFLLFGGTCVAIGLLFSLSIPWIKRLIRG